MEIISRAIAFGAESRLKMILPRGGWVYNGVWVRGRGECSIERRGKILARAGREREVIPQNMLPTSFGHVWKIVPYKKRVGRSLNL